MYLQNIAFRFEYVGISSKLFIELLRNTIPFWIAPKFKTLTCFWIWIFKIELQIWSWLFTLNTKLCYACKLNKLCKKNYMIPASIAFKNISLEKNRICKNIYMEVTVDFFKRNFTFLQHLKLLALCQCRPCLKVNTQRFIYDQQRHLNFKLVTDRRCACLKVITGSWMKR